MKYRHNLYIKAFIVIVTAILFSGCSQERLLIKGDYGSIEIYRHDDHKKHGDWDRDRDRHKDKYRHRHEDRDRNESRSRSRDRHEHYKRSRYKKIPPGQMPPHGKCRIWLPGVPPGHQPPPGACRRLSRHVPPGAWLIRG
jgi:hypothetical protein